MLAIVDYGVGNLFSLQASLNYLGIENIITADKELLQKCKQIILPGVGAFADAAGKLRQNHLDSILCELAMQGKPLLGICLGMQLLFDRSYEYGCHHGLGLLRGEIIPFEGNIAKDLRIPHMGWNNIHIQKEDELLRGNENSCFYFVHSYFASQCEESVIAYVDYGVKVPAFVRHENIVGVQGHPEKSGEAGLKFLQAFARM